MSFRVLAAVGICLSAATAALGQAPAETAPNPAFYHSGWGEFSADGSLAGRVVTIEDSGALAVQPGSKVTLMKNQVIIATTVADADGVFSLSGVKAGVYELLSESERSFAAFSFQAVPAQGGKKLMHVYASSMPRLEVDQVLKQLWAPQIAELPAPAFDKAVTPQPAAVQTPRVIMVDGSVSGQVAFASSGNIPEAHVIKVMRHGDLLATAPVDSLGRFYFSLTSPGPIDVVLGGSAYGSLGVEIVDASEDMPVLSGKSANGEKFVAKSASLLQASETLLVPAAGGVGAPATPESAPSTAAAGGPMPGGYGGGFGGGGGGGGGMGGGAALAGMAGLAGLAGLASNGDGFNVNLTTPLGP